MSITALGTSLRSSDKGRNVRVTSITRDYKYLRFSPTMCHCAATFIDASDAAKRQKMTTDWPKSKVSDMRLFLLLLFVASAARAGVSPN